MKKWYVHQTDDKGLAEKLEAVAAEWGQGWPRWYKIDSYLYKTTSPTDTTSYDRKDGSVVTHNDMNYDEHLRNGGGDPIPAAEGERLVAEAKDPYPHYHENKIGSEVYRVDADRQYVTTRLQDMFIHPSSVWPLSWPVDDNSYPRITKAEFGKRVEAAEEQARWAEGSRWTTDDNYTSLLEFDADNHCVRHSKSAQGMWGGGTWERYQVSEITPTRAREILAELKAAREAKTIRIDEARLIVDGNGKVLKNNYGPLTLEAAIATLNKLG